MDNNDPYGKYWVTYSNDKRILRWHSMLNPAWHGTGGERRL